jgi:hypothetical protein
MTNAVAYEDAIVELFDEAARDTREGVTCVQINVHGHWQTLPLEWNKACRLAELSGSAVQIVDCEGDVTRAFVPGELPQTA